MEKTYIRAEDIDVATRYIYNSAEDSKAYADAACTVQLTTSELKNYFIKGAVIVLAEDAGIVAPFGYAEDDGVGSISYITPNSTTATSADIASLVAVADPEVPAAPAVPPIIGN